ncbi:MAG: DNA polymerase Y family protein, partial [Terracidiphilus sp.]
LALGPEPAETLAAWGIHTLGELAALPENELVARLGPQAAEWRALARGAHPHSFTPIEPAFILRESCEFETPVEDSSSLLFLGARMIDRLVERAAARALSLAVLTVHMELSGGRVYRRLIRPALATTDRKFLLKLLQLEIAAHPPQAPARLFTLTAEAGHASTVQLGLFAPQTPEPSRLDVTLARLKAIAGEDRVGSPVLEDSHRPGAFRMDDFAVEEGSGSAEAKPAAAPRLALRRLRPPVAVRVEQRGGRPVTFRHENRRYRITAAYGPWRSSGAWWSAGSWNAEEWDVLAESPGASLGCLLVCLREEASTTRAHWQLEAFYD